MAATQNLHSAFSLMMITNESLENVKFHMEIDHRLSYKFCMNCTVYMLPITNMVTVQNYEVVNDKFNIFKMYASLCRETE